MRMTVNDKGDRLDVNLFFPDSRVVDLEIALRLVGRANRWEIERADPSIDHTQFRIDSGGVFLATVHVTHGLEPPTRALIENRPQQQEDYQRAARGSTLAVAQALIEECAARGMVSPAKKDVSVAQLERQIANQNKR